MRQHKQPPRFRRPQHQRRHLARTFYSKSQFFNRIHFAAILAEPTVALFPFYVFLARHSEFG